METPEQQLQQLEQEYQRRRQELSQKIGEQEQVPEKETMSQVVEESIQQHAPSFQASSHAAPTDSAALSPEEEKQVQEWVNLVFSSGLSAGIKAAQAANDPALLDAFHATLTGELHEQLVAQKKLDNL
ncbi:MAG: hypothetical protein A3C88_00685 [Candidatus Yanofskybacteria bacterium RIFCSPHIGHO2_02_FULL_50_12]|uniref:Uncharacterized protein n=2 Tax=Parcubacteria group TaxID=1794811 RepID=A0A1F8FWK9_9BACT|nr:MAG: hypothetical protein A3C88_00685 [Candidatus Yanofskybacteria bacterium RIFCSPHIGHO2_02_FULL_50_12]OHA31517.1 MAG: hypothetical protein A3B11_00975 [Candidatus Taylorbacteria bacterium RIFCSPLOWO2_01_FULL_44_26]